MINYMQQNKIGYFWRPKTAWMEYYGLE